MRTSRVKAKLAKNEPALITALHFAEPSVYEMTSVMGFDGIWLDLEHHGASVQTAANLMRAARVGVADIIARPAKGEFMRMGRMLEMGAQGIMYPRCESAAEAREVVRWAKFAPLGQRGIDSGNPDGMFCGPDLNDYLKHANAETFIVIQLEEQKAVDEAEAIAAVEGVDALMLGPGDYSILSGFPGQWDHPRIMQATEKIAAAARNAGKHWGRPMGSVDAAQQFLEMGARLVFHGCDLIILKQGLEDIQKNFTPLGFTFDNRLR